jgi:hypothetical protein
MLNSVSSPDMTASKSVYYQSTCFGNLPRLLDSFSQSDIHYKLLTGVDHLPRCAGEPAEMVELLMSQAGYEKFQQIFLGQRCVRLTEYGEHVFWDSRTGLTLHVMINAETGYRSVRPMRRILD